MKVTWDGTFDWELFFSFLFHIIHVEGKRGGRKLFQNVIFLVGKDVYDEKRLGKVELFAFFLLLDKQGEEKDGGDLCVYRVLIFLDFSSSGSLMA